MHKKAHKRNSIRGTIEMEEEAMQSPDKHPSAEQHVEELTGPDDYWMTITDSARATRRQDVTIRRWIASGDLPVRKYRVGLNRRSRQVRASDVAKLTPIIDTSAMLSGDEAKISLTNIPAEHAVIKADHQQLLTEVARWQALLIEQKRTTEIAFFNHQASWQQKLQDSEEAFQRQLAAQQDAMKNYHLVNTQLISDLRDRLTQHTQITSEQQRQLQQIEGTQMTQAVIFRNQYRTLEDKSTQQHLEIGRNIEAIKASAAKDSATIHDNAEAFAQQLTHLVNLWTERFAQQVQARENLQAQLQQVQQEQQTMAQQIQQKQQSMAQQIEELTRQLAESQARQEQTEKQVESHLGLLNQQSASLQEEQQTMAQQIATLTKWSTEEQAQQEKTRQQAEKQLVALLEKRFLLLEQQVSDKSSKLK
jgi:hypothetical protein